VEWYLRFKEHSSPGKYLYHYLFIPFQTPLSLTHVIPPHPPPHVSDPQLKEIIRALDESLPPAPRFIIADLDDTSIFIKTAALGEVEKRAKDYTNKLHYEQPKRDA
jgi:hypothetical protein